MFAAQRCAPLQGRRNARQHSSRHAHLVVRAAAQTRSITAKATSSASVSSSTTRLPATDVSFQTCCPICQSHTWNLTAFSSRATNLNCPRCNRTFQSGEAFTDLTLTSGLKQRAFNQKGWGGQELFRSPLISFVYERGWRQGFAWAGFPGADKEFDMAMGFLRPAYGDQVVDMSCGSGLFTRRFARSGQFSGVIAADFSESMLQQTKAYLQEDGTTAAGSSAPVLLLRADVGRLPFATGSVAAIHAGAAIHCWPNPQAALAEISRVLKPGGVFVASTFLVAGAPLGKILGDDLVRPLNGLDSGLVGKQYKWWEEAELRDLCEMVGLEDFTCVRDWRFILFSATKPMLME